MKDIIKKYLNGTMQYDDFVKCINKEMLVYLDEKFKNAVELGLKEPSSVLNTFQKYYEWLMKVKDPFFVKASMYEIIYKIINDNDIAYYNIYEENFRLSLEAIPEYLLSDQVCAYIENNIFSKIPKEFSKTKKNKFVKDECKKVFLYESKKPNWVQESEWPVINNKPLKFISQKRDGELVRFYFINEETKEEYIIEQYS